MVNNGFIQALLILPYTFLLSTPLISQDTTTMAKINTEVWNNFEKAFLTNDVALLESLHAENILRIPADKKVIVPGKEYFESQEKSFDWIKVNDYQIKMELRFTERICSEKYASERGIFRFRIDDGEETRIIYGEFHVILQNINRSWKIILDYDSSEEGTITAEYYEKAYDKWNFKPFLR
jgi:hypothetical protein